MSTYSTEILPYGLRAPRATLALFFNQYANAPALEALAWKYYIFYCVFLAFEVVTIYLYFVETCYTPMEEIAKYFDGPDAGVAHVAELTVQMARGKGMEDGEAIEVSEVEVAPRGGKVRLRA